MIEESQIALEAILKMQADQQEQMMRTTDDLEHLSLKHDLDAYASLVNQLQQSLEDAKMQLVKADKKLANKEVLLNAQRTAAEEKDHMIAVLTESKALSSAIIMHKNEQIAKQAAEIQQALRGLPVNQLETRERIIELETTIVKLQEEAIIAASNRESIENQKSQLEDCLRCKTLELEAGQADMIDLRQAIHGLTSALDDAKRINEAAIVQQMIGELGARQHVADNYRPPDIESSKVENVNLNSERSEREEAKLAAEQISVHSALSPEHEQQLLSFVSDLQSSLSTANEDKSLLQADNKRLEELLQRKNGR